MLILWFITMGPIIKNIFLILVLILIMLIGFIYIIQQQVAMGQPFTKTEDEYIKEAKNEIQSINPNQLPKMSKPPTLKQLINWTVFVNSFKNQKTSCFITNFFFRAGLDSYYLLKWMRMEQDKSKQFSLNQVPKELLKTFSQVLCFGFGITIPDGDHYFCFCKNEDNKYVLIHSWQDVCSLQTWCKVPLDHIASQYKAEIATTNPSIYLFNFLNDWLALAPEYGIEKEVQQRFKKKLLILGGDQRVKDWFYAK